MCRYISLFIVFIWIIFSIGSYFFVCHGGLSEQPSDWGGFGSYLSGVITVPFSLISAYFLYKTYKSTERAYIQSLRDSKVQFSHQAIKEASEFLDSALDVTFKVGDDKYSFREIHYNPMLIRDFLRAAKNHEDLNSHYRACVGKAFICLYDFLVRAENEFGMTEFIRFYKVKYQWVITLHNQYDIGVIDLSPIKTSQEIENYFYDVGAITKS